MINPKIRKLIQKFFTHLFLILMAVIIILPFIWMLISSFKDNNEVFDSSQMLPTKWKFSNYPEAWKLAPFGTFFKNSIIITICVVISQLTTCSLAGFSFAKLKFKFKNSIFMLFLACLMIPKEATVISNYITVYKMGLMNSYLGIMLPSLTSVFGVFLLRQFYMTVPNDFLEAASLDGCGKLRAFISIFIPMSKSALASLGVFGMIGAWNDYMWPMIITNSTKYQTLQTGIRVLIREEIGSEWGYLMAVSTIVVLPIILIFIALQKYFIQGITKVGLK